MTTQFDVGAWRKSTRSGSGGNGSNCIEVGAWRKSTRTGGGGSGNNCVEVGACSCASSTPSHGIAIRDTKDRTGPVLSTHRLEWTSFLAAVKNGAFDA